MSQEGLCSFFAGGIVSHTTDEHLHRNMKLATRLKNARQQRGLSTREAERISGVSKAMLSRIENGFDNPTLKTIKKLAKLYGIKPAEWFE